MELDQLLAHRKAATEKAGVSLYALRALAMALSENSAPAGRLIGSQVIHPGSIDIGFAVEADDGVLVPVIREADKHSLDEMVPMYARLVELARQRRLTPADMGQCISTVTNYGTFGLTLATPIPLPEVITQDNASLAAPPWEGIQAEELPLGEAQLVTSWRGTLALLLARVQSVAAPFDATEFIAQVSLSGHTAR